MAYPGHFVLAGLCVPNAAWVKPKLIERLACLDESDKAVNPAVSSMDRFEIVDPGASQRHFLGPVPQVIGNEPKNLMGNSKVPIRSACWVLVEDRLTPAAINRKEMMLTLSSLIVY